jgi:hypothetical protein
MTPAGTSSKRAELWKLRRLKAGVEEMLVARRRAGIERAREAIVCVDCEVCVRAWCSYEVCPGVELCLEMRKCVAWSCDAGSHDHRRSLRKAGVAVAVSPHPIAALRGLDPEACHCCLGHLILLIIIGLFYCLSNSTLQLFKP